MATAEQSNGNVDENNGLSKASPAGSVPLSILTRTPTKPNTLEDTLLLAGLFNSGEAEFLVRALRQAKDTRLEVEGEAYKFSCDLRRKQIEEIEKAKQQADEEIAALKEEQKKNAEKLNSLKEEQERLSVTRNGLARRLLLKRCDYPLRLFNRRAEEYTKVTKDLFEGILSKVRETTSSRGGYSREPESDKAFSRLEAQRIKAEERCEEVEQYINHLRRFGITQTTAGFLAWGGYLSFPAFGWFIGETIRKLRNSEGGLLESIFALLVGGIKAIFEAAGLFSGIVTLLILPIFLLASLVLIFWLVDKFLRWFDPAWDYQRGKRGIARTSRGDISGWAWVSSPVRTMVRSDYTQLLAKLPVIYLWAVIPVLFAILFSLGGKWVDIKMPDPWHSLFYTYFGGVLCVAVSGVVLLYCTKVIEPRHKRYLHEEALGLVDTIKANTELVVILLLFLLLVVLSDTLSVFPVFANVWSAGRTLAIFLLILLSAFAVSYGLIYKGIFKDYDTLKRDLLTTENVIARYVTSPTIDFIEEEFERYKEKYESESRQLNTAIDYERQKPLLRQSWFDFRDVFSSRNEKPLKSIEMGQLSPEDEMVEPDLVGEIIETNQKLNLVTQKLTDVEKAHSDNKDRIGELKNIDWHRKLEHMQEEVLDRSGKHLMGLSRIEQEHAGIIVSCDTAYKMGTFLRNALTSRRRDGNHRGEPGIAAESGITSVHRPDTGARTETGNGTVAEELRKVREEIISLAQGNSTKMDDTSKEFNQLPKRLQSLENELSSVKTALGESRGQLAEESAIQDPTRIGDRRLDLSAEIVERLARLEEEIKAVRKSLDDPTEQEIYSHLKTLGLK